jgi:peroxiredoxin
MQTIPVRLLLAAALFSATLAGFSAEPGATKKTAAKPAKEQTAAQKELSALVAKIQEKIRDGQKTEKDLAAELKEFDALLDKHKGEKTDDVAQILVMKAMLYTQVIDDTEKGLALLQQLKKDFPDTTQGKRADQQIAGIEKGEAAKKVQRSLAVGSKFPDFQEKDIEGKPLSISGYKGKVLLVDFWATWCGPCVKELPSVQAAYDKHHKNGFEILGISLDQDEKKLRTFIKDKNMPWRQYFDGKGWGSKLGAQYGVNSIPATYLLDAEGVIIGKSLRGEALEKAVAAALAKK